MIMKKPAHRHAARQARIFSAVVAIVAALMTTHTLPASAFELVRNGKGKATAESWLIADWPAGQSKIMRWAPGNIVATEDGGMKVILDQDPEDKNSYRGGEIQSSAVAEEGTWEFRAKAPDMVSGAVFGMFLYQANWKKDPWREYDIEFVGSDTTRVQLNIHFQDANGKRISLDQARGGPVIVDLGFDAAEGMHDYAIDISPGQVIFRVDGEVLGQFGPDDMPGNIWSDGRLRGFVDLWAAAPGQADWTGRWNYPGKPLVARVERLKLPVGATLP